MMNLEEKVLKLRRRLRELESAVVALSGGVDSAVLTILAHQELKNKMAAATAVSASLPVRDKKCAVELCHRFKIKHFFFNTDEFSNVQYLANPDNRCYHCKAALYNCLQEARQSQGYNFIIEGTNSSDLHGHRPGAQASKENFRVVTPLIECAITKEEVRQIARQLKLDVADKPSSACLSSRLPAGTKITPELLSKIDQAEEMLRNLGLGQVRLRHHGDLARLEVEPREFQILLENREKIYADIKQLGYKFVTLDLQGYRTGGIFA